MSKELIEVVGDLAARGIELRSLKESIDTSTPTGKLMFHVIAALAEFERDIIQERALAGLEAARARGRKAPQMQPGYCYHCGCWLGDESGLSPCGPPSKDELQWREWAVAAVGELVTAVPALPGGPGRWMFASAVAQFLDSAVDGNISALARVLQVSRRTVRDWMKGEQIPQLSSLIQFCYLCGIRPLHLFTRGTIDVDPAETNRVASPNLKRQIKKHYRVFPAEQVRRALQAELLVEKDLPQPMSTVARRLEYDQSFLYKHFPDLCRAISGRYRVYRKKKREDRRQKILDEVRQMTFRVHAQELYPSQERVRLLLAKPGSIKEPGALAVWHDALQELGLETGGT